MAEVKWIKITTDIFDDEKISLIDGMPERDGIIVIWFKLLCMAGKLNNGGVFMLNDKIAYTDEMLATIFRRPLNTVRLALSTFEQYGMIDIINNAYIIPNWEKHQSLGKMEAAKEKNRQRVAAHREKQKLLTAQCNDYSNDSVTQCNAIDKDKDIDRDIDKKSVRETTHTLFERLLPDYALDCEKHAALKSKMEEWIKYKTERKEPYKEQGMKALLRQVENNALTYGDEAVCNLIDESMSNGWKGIIFDRLKQKPIQNAQQPYQGSGSRRNAPPSGVDRLLAMVERGDFDE